MMRSSRLRWLVVVLAALALSVPALAQKITGDIAGDVTDKSGAVVPGATATAVSVGTNLTRNAATSNTGSFRINDLPIGTYKVSVAKEGFKTTQRTMEVSASGLTHADFALEVGQRSETVTVEGAAPLVEFAPNNNNYVDNAKIETVPLNGRDFNSLLAITPGVQRAPGGGFLAISINGSRTTSNNYLIDGLYNNDRYYGDASLGQTGVLGIPAAIFPPEAIAELNVQETPSAEFGVKGGAPINMVMKGGTNTLHGTAQYTRHTDFADAANFFSKFTGCTDVPSPCHPTPIRNQQFGATIGGPIFKDKTFFFGFYEGQRAVTLATKGQIVPASEDAALALAAVGGFAGTPGSLATVVGSNLFKLFPTATHLPNLEPGHEGEFLDVGRLVTNVPTTDSMNAFGIKIDHRFSASHSISGKYIFGDSLQSAPNIGLPAAAPNSQDLFNSVAPSRTQLAGLSHVWNIGNNKVLESRFGWNRFAQIITVNNSIDPRALGIDTGQLSSADFGVPYLYLSNLGYGGYIGGVQGYPITTRPDQTYDWSEHFSWVKGNHTIKFGGNYQTAYTNSLRNRARTGIALGYTNSDTVSILEQLLLGKVDNVNRNFGDTHRHIRQKAFGLYAQDEWKIKPRLTLTYGLRWELNAPLSEQNSLGANFIPGRGLITLGQGISSLYNRDVADFGPRVGFAWDIFGNGKTALRGGYSLTYDVPNFGTLAAPYSFARARAGSFTQPFQGGVSSNGVSLSPNNGTCPASDPSCDPSFPDLNPDPFTGVCSDPNNPSTSPGDFMCIDNATFGPAFGNDTSGTPPFNAFSVVRNFKTPRTHNYNLSIQREVTHNQVLTVGYSGSYGQNLVILSDINASPLGGGDQPFEAAFPGQFNHIIQATNLGYSRYDSLQASFNQRNWHNINLTYNYTFSKCLDTNSVNRGGAGVGGYPQINNDGVHFRADGSPIPNVADNRGLCDHDVRHNFNVSGLYSIPTFHGVPKVIGQGWQLSTIYTAISGRPFTPVLGSSDVSGQGLIASSLRPSWDGTPIKYNTRDPNHYVVQGFIDDSGAFDANLLDPCGRSPFATLPDNTPNDPNDNPPNPAFDGDVGSSLPVTPFFTPCTGTVGNSRRNMLIGPGLSQWDITVIKDTKITERFTVQFRWEVFNIFNRANFHYFPDNTLSQGSFSTISKTSDVASGNPVVAQGGPRNMNFALKIIF